MTEAAATRRGRRRRPTATGVAGEILITVGVVVLLYVAWQLWIGDLIIGSQRSDTGRSIAASWAATATPTDAASPTATGDDGKGSTSLSPAPATADPIALPQPGDGEVFGVMYVPRWGSGFSFPVAGGVSRDVTLDPGNIGHYPDTAMPGQPGNFAVAGHRGSSGAPFENLPSLHIGDAVVIETQDGWYTYRFRNLEYVDPTSTDVLMAVPQVTADANGDYLTMTTCSPRFGSAERLIAYGVFESFTPRSSGEPRSLTVAAGA